MTRIAVDIDDTLYSFNNLAREMFVNVALEHNDKTLQRGAYCFWGEWRSPSDLYGNEFWMEVIGRCHSNEMILAQKPYPGAVDTLTELRDQGYELIYISGRKEATHEATSQWLMIHGFPAGDLICTMDDKMPYLKQCQFIIDDRPKTLCDFVYDFDWKVANGLDKQRKGFAIFGEHNRALTDVPNVYLAPNWKLLRQYMIDKDVILPFQPALFK